MTRGDDATNPLTLLAGARAQISGTAFRATYREYRPPSRVERPGGDLDEPETLTRVLPSAVADGEVMLLCMGNEGTMRMAANLILSLRAMGLHHMLAMAPERGTCDALWITMPTLACVWWPSQFARKRPSSLYNDMFSRTSLAFFEARKVLVERLVIERGLNLLHLDGDTVWFANPYPIFKTLYSEHALVFQTDNPFVNAGVFYVQHTRKGDAAAWVLQELNRRIARFTYDPASVQKLPHSSWARAPYFANADEQANLNDVIASSVSGELSFAGGVEFMEARFKERFAPRRCFGGGGTTRDVPGCDGVAAARERMRNGHWHRDLNEGGSVAKARRMMRPRYADGGRQYASLVHLCEKRGWEAAKVGTLRVPGNESAPTARLALAPPWLFSHFPYGTFFDAFRKCHDSWWSWSKASTVERRLCVPEHRVPTIMVHMAGLRQESWGRRTLMRALGVWQDAADAVAPEAWVSSRAPSTAASLVDVALADGPKRVATWTGVGRLLVTDGLVSPTRFRTMGEYDHFAARLLLLALLLRRRAVLPPIDCNLPYMRKALQARHLRGMEVGCGAQRQCVWLPYPHHIEPWCAGVDWLWDTDYQSMLSGERGEAEARLVRESAHMAADRLQVAKEGPPEGGRNVSRLLGAQDASARVLILQGTSKSAGSPVAAADGDAPLGWIPLGGFRVVEWKAPWPRRVEAALRAPQAAGGLGLSEPQVHIVKTCLKSLATSKE